MTPVSMWWFQQASMAQTSWASRGCKCRGCRGTVLLLTQPTIAQSSSRLGCTLMERAWAWLVVAVMVKCTQPGRM